MGKIYNVYGINSWNKVTHFLLTPEEERPNWYPSEMFSINQNKIPNDWYFNNFNVESGLTLLLGYKELVLEDEHYDNLIYRVERDLELFLKRKKEIDNLLQQGSY